LRTWVRRLTRGLHTRAFGGHRKPALWSREGVAGRWLTGWKTAEGSDREVAAQVRQRRTAAWLGNAAHGGDSKAYRRYVRLGLAAGQSYVKRSLPLVADTANVGWLARARLSAVPTGHQWAAAGLVPAVYRTKCVACGGAGVKDNVEHITTECPAYAAERETWLESLWQRQPEAAAGEADVEAGGEEGLSSQDKLRLALGSETLADGSAALVEWLPTDGVVAESASAIDSDDDDAASDGSSISGGSESPATDGGNGVKKATPGFVLAARFFGTVLPLHRRRVLALVKEMDQGTSQVITSDADDSDASEVPQPQTASANHAGAGGNLAHSISPGVNAPDGVGQNLANEAAR
jgi:hypothetical protein